MAVIFVENENTPNEPMYRRVLDSLADIWDNYGYPATIGPITAAHMAWDKAAMVYSAMKLSKKFSHLSIGDEYLKALRPSMPIQLWFVDEMPADISSIDDGIILCLKVSDGVYEIPEFIREIYSMQDSINFPTYTLIIEDGGYSTSTNLLRGYTGTITFGSVTLARKMWVTVYMEKKNEELVSRFGSELGYEKTIHDEVRTVTDMILLRMALLHGPTTSNLALAFTIIQGWPYGTMKSKLSEATASTFTLSSYPYNKASEVMDNPTELESPIPLGTIIPFGYPFLEAIHVCDRTNYENFGYNFGVGAAEVYHKGIVVVNGDLAARGDLLGILSAAPIYPFTLFVVNEKVVGQTSGAFGYVREVNANSLRLYGVFGAFVDGEIIKGDVAGDDKILFLNGELDPRYKFDFDAHNTFLEKTERYGADLELRFVLNFKPDDADVSTTYGLPLSAPESSVVSDGPDYIPPPTSILITDAFVSITTPVGSALTDFGIMPVIPEMNGVSTDFGLGLTVPGLNGVTSTNAGYLAYDTCTAAFRRGSVLTGVTSGATSIIAEDNSSGARGTLLLINVHGTYEDGEIIRDEFTGIANADGGLVR